MNHITQRSLSWVSSGTPMTGVLVADERCTMIRPGVVLAPNMMGVTESNISHARKIAEKGYVVLVADLYGFIPSTAEEAAAAMNALKDTPLERDRMYAALTALAAQQEVDHQRLAVVGFCYGGHCALELARSGASVKAAICIHGTLSTLHPAEPGKIKGKVLVLNGAQDPFVTPDQVGIFCHEMSEASVGWQFINYANTVHSFTYPKADVPGKMEYNEPVSNQAFANVFLLLEDVFN